MRQISWPEVCQADTQDEHHVDEDHVDEDDDDDDDDDDDADDNSSNIDDDNANSLSKTMNMNQWQSSIITNQVLKSNFRS